MHFSLLKKKGNRELHFRKDCVYHQVKVQPRRHVFREENGSLHIPKRFPFCVLSHSPPGNSCSLLPPYKRYSDWFQSLCTMESLPLSSGVKSIIPKGQTNLQGPQNLHLQRWRPMAVMKFGKKGDEVFA